MSGLIESQYWKSSAFIWTYDDWGGWYDHVKPPRVDKLGYGFRVPALLVSPYARRGHIDHTTLDFTSVLKFIEDNWNLKPLASRDANANSIAGAFDFSQTPRSPAIVAAVRGVKPPPTPKRSIIYPAYGIRIRADSAPDRGRRGNQRAPAPSATGAALPDEGTAW